MRRLTVEAVRAGAFGFTTSRADSHQTAGGAPLVILSEELWALAQRLGERGTFSVDGDFDDETAELAWLTQLAGRPPPGLVPAHRPLRGPGTLATAGSGGTRRAPGRT
jgi:N-acyl-D-aspartate/D-glutamate deacylase